MIKTKIIKISQDAPEPSKIRSAAVIIKKGGLVAFPTETVYGLGADALNPEAVKKIFNAKARPADNPLIIHIAEKKQVYEIAEKVPKAAEKLMNKFWPGPLTIILKKTGKVPSIITGGLGKVAIRMPKSKIALALINKSGKKIAAPSANSFGRPSPTSAQHVILDLKGKIDMIIDGGNTEIGLESTVIDMSTATPVLMRPGKVTLEQLEEQLGRVIVHPAILGKKKKVRIAESPGLKYKHYAPRAELVLVYGSKSRIKEKMQQIADDYRNKGKKVGIISCSKSHCYAADCVKFAGNTQESFAKCLFSLFREFDKTDVDVIIVSGTEEKSLGLAVMNRLRKASTRLVKV